MMLMVQEQFLQMPDNVVANESKDQEYWLVYPLLKHCTPTRA